jgi:hypothetical protein
MNSQSRIVVPAGEQEIRDIVEGQNSAQSCLPLAALWQPESALHEKAQQTSTGCWACLGIILVLFLSYIEILRPASLFGYFHDDTLYFSSARAIATGQGYIIPSLPGTPPQTKYPILYSWLLSWVWKWFPNFPGNVVPAIWLTAFFGCWFLVAAFQFLRGLDGIGNWAALGIVAAIAFSPDFLMFNTSLLSDIPFMALALTAMVLADSALDSRSPGWLAALAGCIAGLSADMRTLGVATVAGILFIALGRREFRKGLIIMFAAAPFVVFAAWPVLNSAHSLSPGNGSGSLDPAWNQTWLYYTSYLANWTASVPNVSMFLQMIKNTGVLLLVAPVRYVLSPSFEPWSPAGMGVYVPLTLALIAGIARLVRIQGWKPVHAVFLVYSAILLVWPYPQMYRFLLLFMPLFFAGLYVEMKRIVRAIVENLRSSLPVLEKLSALALSAILLATGSVVLWNYAHGGRTSLNARIERRASILQEKEEAYEWIRNNTKTSTKIVAFEDVMLYLYTGRQTMRPISFLPSCCVTDQISILQSDLNHITDVPRRIQAGFWLMSDDYFDAEGSIPLIHAKMIELKSTLPLAFSSREGHVQIYDLSKLAAFTPSDSPRSVP